MVNTLREQGNETNFRGTWIRDEMTQFMIYISSIYGETGTIIVKLIFFRCVHTF